MYVLRCVSPPLVGMYLCTDEAHDNIFMGWWGPWPRLCVYLNYGGFMLPNIVLWGSITPNSLPMTA